MRTQATAIAVLMAFLLALGTPSASHAAEWEFSSSRPDLMQRLGTDAGSDLQMDETGTAGVPGKKNIGRGLLFSLIVPGTGQLYATPWWRALPWFAIEAAGWTVFAIYQKKGNDKTDEFQDFADIHFDRDKYRAAEDSIWHELGELYNEDGSRKLPDNFTHTLPPTNTQQYYEMIGKYLSQFGYGWDDATGDNPDGPTYAFDGTTANFFFYRDMRGEANDLLSTANVGMEVVLVNHILSALDAAFMVRQHNRRVDRAAGISDYLIYERKQIHGADTRMLTLRIPLD